MAFENFHCVVVGNEPAGLWLLASLDKALRAVGEEPRLGWLSLDTTLEPTAVPAAVSPWFGITPSAPWSCEFITPRETFTWNAKELAKRYGEALPPLENSLESLLRPTSRDKLAVSECLRRHPELVGFAEALWTFLGRSTQLNVETLVHFSRILVNLHWWAPDKEIPSSVQQTFFSLANNPVEKISRKGFESVVIDFRDLGSMESEHWVLNLDTRALRTWGARSDSFQSLLGGATAYETLRGRYPFTLRVETDAVPSAAAPLNFLLDSDSIPDPMTEVWPVTLGASGGLREVTVWTESGADTSIEACLDGFQKALRRLHYAFPFVAPKTVGTSFSLGMGSCSSDAERNRVTETLLSSSREIYPLTTSYTQTRMPRVHALSPQLGCHLPYPLGPLLKAKELQKEILGKKKKPIERVQAAPLDRL